MRRCCASSNAPGGKRHFCMAVVSVVLAAAALVALAVPVVNARRAHQALLAASRNGSAPGTASSRGAAGEGGLIHESAAFTQMLPQGTPSCNGVQGLCSVPVRLVTFPGSHNSNAVKNREFIAEAQELGFKEQLDAGARLFDIDYAGGSFGARFGHCLSCFCSFSSNPADSDPVQVFQIMADFLAANPRDVIVLGLSNINCGDKSVARAQLLGLLAQSPLLDYIATQVVGPNTTLGDLVDSNQRVVLLFYDQWASETGHQVGGKAVPSQPLLRLYGGDTTIDASGADAIDKQVATALMTDIGKQFKASSPSIEMTWRVLGMFPSTCLSCRNALQCGPISCAMKANSEPYIMYQLGKLTTQWLASQRQSQLVPAMNGFQVDYFGVAAEGNRGPVEASQRLNRGFAWMYTLKPAEAAAQGLGNCVWVLDDAVYAGGLACVHHGQLRIDALLGIKSATSDDILSGIFSSFVSLPGSSNSNGKNTSTAGSGAVAVNGSSSSSSGGGGGGSGSSSSSSSAWQATGRKLAAAAAATAATAANAVTADTASSSAGRSNRWILLPANGKLQLQLLLNDVVVRRVYGMPGKLTWVDVGSSADSLQVLWPASSQRRLVL